jgi:hypothetical protein
MFVSCTNGERYELSVIAGLGITTDMYEYNYIDFNFDNNTYILENKVRANGIISKQTGTFSEDSYGDVVISNEDIPSQDYILYYNEQLSFSNYHNKFYVSAMIDGIEVVMIYTKK